jgi:hypothetical protein
MAPWFTERTYVSEAIHPGRQAAQTSTLRAFLRRRDHKIKIDIAVDHYYAFQGHATLSLWTAEGYKTFVSIPRPECDWTEESLRALRDELLSQYDAMVEG